MVLISVNRCVLITSMKEIRFNANLKNSLSLRTLKKEYEEKFSPLKVSLETLSNLSLEYGLGKVREHLKLNGK